MNWRRFLIVVLSVLPICYVSAQEFSELNFNHYTKADGLSHNTVTGLAQDSAGYMWVATAYGLNRYNGSRFVQFHSNDDSSSLSSEPVAELVWLDKHRLCAYQANGLHVIDTRTGETRNLFIPYHRQQYLYKYNMVMQASGDELGNIFVLCRSGFYQFDKNYNLVFRFDYYSEEEVFTEHFYFGVVFIELDTR